MNIWKLSHGTDYFDKKQHEKYLSQKIVCVHSNKAPFLLPERKYNIFYVCRGNDHIDFIGIFTEELSSADEDDSGWHYRNFIPLIDSQMKTSYSGEQKGWTPNFRSTFFMVPEYEQGLFEKLILKPFFDINLQTLEKLYKDKLQELKMKENLQPYIELLTHSKNLVFTGAPGTGKTYLAKRIAEEFTTENITDPLTLIQKYHEANSAFLEEEEKQCEVLRQEFLKLFPLETIENITLDEYCVGDRDNYPDNFCRWIERKLNLLGTFHPSARGSNVYIIYKKGEPDEYSIKKPFSKETPETVIHLIGKAILKIGETGKYIGTLPLNKDLIMKIANSYDPDFYFPVYAKKHMETICEKFAILKDKDVYEMNRHIKDFFEEKLPLLSFWTIMSIIYKLFISESESDIFNEDIELDSTTNSKYVEFVQFHPSYDYTDFVEGLRPVKKEGKEIGFELKNGSFKKICIEAKKFPSNKYVFIIDEINRAEISKVFGELFFSIDPGYRGKNDPKDRDKIVKVQLQYSNLYTEGDDFYDGFYVPENVYIIATMNDIDRSVEPFDFAMKRRFTWCEITPKDTYDNMWKNQPWYDDAYKRMTALNNAITDPQKLNFSSAYHIGPAYFLKLNNFEDIPNLSDKFEELWKYHIKPVLKEYVKGLPDAKGVFEKLEVAYKPDNSNE